MTATSPDPSTGVAAATPLTAVPLSVQWVGGVDGYLRLLDQTQLPLAEHYLECRCVAQVAQAIRQLQVRGAPAIGVAAAYGVCVGAAELGAGTTALDRARLLTVIDDLAGTRPTAVNLFWALDRQRACLQALPPDVSRHEAQAALLNEAQRIHAADREACRAIGRYGASLLPARGGILTHCNAGSLATSEFGTALACIYAAHAQGKRLHVFADETRPLLQGARLTAWELQRHGIPTTLICDSMAGQVMKEGRVQAVVVGADRIAANGDVANKIGTYTVAVLARAHGIPFYVAAPTSTFDLQLPHGDQIPIEARGREEIVEFGGRPTAPSGIPVYNPAFDVTPAELVQAVITERGIIQPVTAASIRAMFASMPAAATGDC